MHGGDIYRHRVVLDFSVNINPLGPPRKVMESLYDSLWRVDTYPDPESRALREGLGRRYGIPEKQVLAGNGASELITAIVRAVQPKKALLLSPCFSGYERALRSAGCQVRFCPLGREQNFAPGGEVMQTLLREKPDLFFLASPGNPAGAVIRREDLLAAADAMRAFGGVLVSDECFLALAGQEKESIAADPEAFLSRPGCIALNAFTKTYAVPGVRIGYALFSDAELAGKAARQLSEWSVSVPAQAAGLACLSVPDSYLEKSTALIRREREVLSRGLSELGFSVYPSESCYLLFSSDRADLGQALLSRGILIRDCSDYHGLHPGDFRTAVRKHEDNEMLLAALGEITGSAV